MFKKKLSGQTVVIVILTILLLLTLCFGGVFAYYTYSSSKITGEIIMASLSIDLETSNTTDKSVISISNKGQVVPGEKLKNSALNLKNSSSISFSFDSEKDIVGIGFILNPSMVIQLS